MNKKLVAVAVLAISGFTATSVLAAEGRVSFTGKILDSACQVVNSATSPLVVNMGEINKSAFSGVNTTAAPTAFTVTLRGCPSAATSARIKFDGTAKNNDNKILDLTQVTGVATGVGIQLYDKNGAILPLFSESTSSTLAPSTTEAPAVENKLSFVARYIATSATVTAGPANAMANFTVMYN